LRSRGIGGIGGIAVISPGDKEARMAKTTPIVVNDESFPSKAALRRRVQAILYGGDPDEDSVAFLRDLVRRHRSAAEKIGPGIQTFRIVKVVPYNTAGFEIVRVDGTVTDVSYLECINETTPRHWFPAACRNAVFYQVAHVKDEAFAISDSIQCPITGEPLTRETCHADHAPPWTFEAIVDAFIAEHRMDPSKVNYVEGDGSVGSRFADAQLSARFAAFHLERASLRVVSKRANLSVLCKKTLTM
jgi:hypothetical protein